MQSVRSMIELHNRRARRGGFSLIEMMIVLTVIGIMVAISAPSYTRTVEQSRADIATANLRAIWSAERVYWLEGHIYAPSSKLQELKLLDPELLTSLIGGATIGGYVYSLTPAADLGSFSAMATRDGTSNYLTIDSDGKITSVGSVVTPGFQ